MSEEVAQTQIRSYFDRWSRLEEEKAAISDDLRELFAEMKSNGFDTKVARKVFRDRGADANERAEFEAIYDLYWSALEGPRARRADARVETIEEFPSSMRSEAEVASGEDIAAESENGHVDRIASASLSGQSLGAQPAGVEAGFDTVVFEHNASGPDVKRAPHSEMDGDAIAAVKGQARPASVVDAETSSSSILRDPKPLRPFCQNRENCAGVGIKHCYSCGKIAAAATPIHEEA